MLKPLVAPIPGRAIRPGAAGNTGADAVAKAAPDGYTLPMAASAGVALD